MSGFKKLSAYVDVPCEWVSIAAPRNSKLEAENAKLRELVEDMLDCIEIRSAFHRPPTTEMYEMFAERACELGIEVDDGQQCDV